MTALRRRLVLAGALAWAAYASPLSAQPVTLRVADVLGPNHYVVKYLVQPWMEEVSKATNNEIRFEFYPSEQLGKARDMLSLALSGVADVAYVAPSYVSEKMPLSAVAQLPGGFSSACQGTLAFWSLAKGGLLEQREFKPNGVRVLAALVQPPYQLFSARRKIVSIKDFAGMKLRTTGGAMDITTSKIQAIPVKMAGPEVLEALGRGTLDGGVFPPASVLANDWQSAVKFATNGENFGSFVLTYVMSERRFAQLPEGVRSVMLRAGEEATRRTCAQVDLDQADALVKLQAAGVAVAPLPDADRQELKRLLSSVGSEWAAQLDRSGKPGSEVERAFGEAVRAQPRT